MNHTPQQREAHLRLVLKRRSELNRQKVLADAVLFAAQIQELLAEGGQPVLPSGRPGTCEPWR